MIREGRELDARADAGAVDLAADAAREPGDQEGRAARRAHRVRRRRIGERAELVEIAAAAERLALAAQHDLLDRGIRERDDQALGQRIAQGAGEGVVAGRAIEPDLEARAVALEQAGGARIPRRPAGLAGARGEPVPELAAGLQRRVDEGLGDEALLDRPRRREAAQELGERDRRDGLLLESDPESVELRAGFEMDVAGGGQRREGRRVPDGDRHTGQPGQLGEDRRERDRPALLRAAIEIENEDPGSADR